MIVLTPLVVAGLITAIGFARAARTPGKRNAIGYVHGSALLLLSFLVLPATSMKIFRLLAPCFKLRTNNTWLHYAFSGSTVGCHYESPGVSGALAIGLQRIIYRCFCVVGGRPASP